MTSRLPPREHGKATADRRPILIVPYMWIGDFVRCHSVVKLLKSQAPDRPVDVLSTSNNAPLLDYMPGVRQGIVWDLPRSRLALRQNRALAQKLQEQGYAQALIMPRTWKSTLAPFFAGIPVRTGFFGEGRVGVLNDVRFGERDLPRMIDQCAALALPKGAELPAKWPLPELIVPAAERSAWRARMDACAREPAHCAGARRGRTVQALAGRKLCRRRRAVRPRRCNRGGGRQPQRDRPGAGSLRRAIRRSATSPGPTCATPSWRLPAPSSPYRTTLACCTWRPRWEHRPSAFSDRPAPGIGRRSTRSPAWCKPTSSSTAGRATSRSAGSAIIAACARSRRRR